MSRNREIYAITGCENCPLKERFSNQFTINPTQKCHKKLRAECQRIVNEIEKEYQETERANWEPQQQIYYQGEDEEARRKSKAKLRR